MWEYIAPIIWAVAGLVRALGETARRLRRESPVSSKYLTVPEAAQRLGMKTAHVRRLYERGLVPPVEIVGRHRLVPVGDLPKVKEAAIAAGYLEK